MAGKWILEVDIRHFFGTLDHSLLRNIARKRVRDGVLLRLIGKVAERRGDGRRGDSIPGGRHAAGRGNFPKSWRTSTCMRCLMSGLYTR
jgi:hypothetical protein